jgi:hypothetical protein
MIFHGLIDEHVPGVAAVIDDVVEGFEDSVRQPVLTHELPDIFLAVELGRMRRQRQERDVAWHVQVFGAMPAGLIEDENGVRTWWKPVATICTAIKLWRMRVSTGSSACRARKISTKLCNGSARPGPRQPPGGAPRPAPASGYHKDRSPTQG